VFVCHIPFNFKGFYMFYIIQFDIFDISLIDSRLKDPCLRPTKKRN